MRLDDFICESAGKFSCNLKVACHVGKVQETGFDWLIKVAVKTSSRIMRRALVTQGAQNNLILVYEDCIVNEVAQTSNFLNLPHSLRSHVAQDHDLELEWKTFESR